MALGHLATPKSDSILQTLRLASSRINQEMETVPSSYLLSTIQRGFRFWPTPSKPLATDFLTRVLKSIVQQAKEACEADLAGLCLGHFDQDGCYQQWIPDDLPKHLLDAFAKYLALEIKEGRWPHIIRLSSSPKASNPLPEEIHSFLAVPIYYAKESLGALCLANKKEPHAFSESDIEMAALLSHYASSALQQTYLHAALSMQQIQLQAILDSAPAGIIFIAAETDEVFANPRAFELFGRSIVSDKGRFEYASQLFFPDGSPVEVKDLPSTQALAGKTSLHREFIIRQPSGRLVPVCAQVAPVTDYGSHISGAVVIFEDISTRKDMAELKASFDAMVVHDLRNPIQAILMQTEILLKAHDENILVRREDLELIQRSATLISNMAGDLLDISRAELGKLHIEPKNTHMATVVQNVIARVKLSNTDRMIDMSQAGVPRDVYLDPLRLEQILTNLLENAIKHSPADKRIEIKIIFHPERVEISVHDQGTGIAPTDLPFVFQRFYQSSSKPKNRRSGLGLGLYISRLLVEAQGGKIYASSTLDKGSTFTIIFPATPA